MDHKTVEEYILSMPNARLDYPFGKEAAVYKVFVPAASSAPHLDAVQGSSDERASRSRATASERGSVTDAVMRQEPAGATGSAGGQDKAVRGDWKMFAIIMEGKDPVQLSLKCDPNLAETLRAKYDTVMPGYHLNKKHWNTIVLTGQLSWDEIKDLIKHSYELVAKI
jgi:predicted DNA-binding protein (MmcQ/YjbR family)